MSRPVLASLLFTAVSLCPVLPTAAQKGRPSRPAAPAAAQAQTRRARLEFALTAARAELGKARLKLAQISSGTKGIQQQFDAAKNVHADAERALHAAEGEQQKRQRALDAAMASQLPAQKRRSDAEARLAEAERSLGDSAKVLEAAQSALRRAEQSLTSEPSGGTPGPGTSLQMRKTTLEQLLTQRRRLERELQDDEAVRKGAEEGLQTLHDRRLLPAEEQVTAAKEAFLKNSNFDTLTAVQRAQNAYVEIAESVLKEEQRFQPALAASDRKELDFKTAWIAWVDGVHALGKVPGLEAPVKDWKDAWNSVSGVWLELLRAERAVEQAGKAVRVATEAWKTAKEVEAKQRANELKQAREANAAAKRRLKLARARMREAESQLQQPESLLMLKASNQEVSVAIRPPSSLGTELEVQMLQGTLDEVRARHQMHEKAKREATAALMQEIQAVQSTQRQVDDARTALTTQQAEVARCQSAVQQAAQNLQQVQVKLGPATAPIRAAEAAIRDLDARIARIRAELDSFSGKGSRWHLSSEKSPVTKNGTGAIVWGDPVDPGNRDVFVGSRDGTIRRGVAGTGAAGLLIEATAFWNLNGVEINGLARSGSRLAVGTSDGQVWLAELGVAVSRRPLRDKPANPQYVRALGFNPRYPHILAIGSSAGDLELWDTSGGKTKLDFLPLSRTILSVSWSHDGQYLAVGTKTLTGGKTSPVVLYRLLENSKKLDRAKTISLEHPQQVNCVAFHPTRLELVTTCADGITRWFRSLDYKTKPVELVSLSGKSPEASVIVSVFGAPDGRYVLTGDTEGWIKLFDLAPALEQPSQFPVLLAEQKVHHQKIYTTAIGAGPAPGNLTVLSGGLDDFLGVSSLSQR